MEKIIVRILVASRWLLVPLYASLALLLVLFTIIAYRKLYALAAGVLVVDEVHLILESLRIVDVTLVASLVVMVMLSGYQNFVGRLDPEIVGPHLAWLKKLDSSSVKVRIAASIVAVSAIDLLHTYMDVEGMADDKLMWRVLIHAALLATAVAVTLLDRFEHPGEAR